jgi:hypothetical protein
MHIAERSFWGWKCIQTKPKPTNFLPGLEVKNININTHSTGMSCIMEVHRIMKKWGKEKELGVLMNLKRDR